ncbi:hypothetical protein G7Z17_g791 [Cylindrodendrum hubeiense]|uniref:Uncharacterized protein n=1 Tax=Cylindrodendrum hubeiense TaxID=595255 RepID=A0A9P5HRF2_9HYPO|nr:hypothetical protein G7Z17_g791 [Cylindrodendrum hubeiense]
MAEDREVGARVASDGMAAKEIPGTVDMTITVALATGSLSAVAASYMLAGGLSYNLFFWVEFAVGCLLFIGTFFFFEESMYLNRTNEDDSANTNSHAVNPDKEVQQTSEQIENTSTIPSRKTYVQQLKVIDQIDHRSPVFMMMIRSFTYFAVPPVFWACTTYGMVIGLGALAFTSTFPAIVAAPPYSWPIENTGLVAIAAFVGYLTAASCFTERQLHWIGLVFAVGLFQFGNFFYLTYTLAYAMDSYEANVPEMLIAMNIGKQAISFGFAFAVLDWISKHGYIIMFAGIFCGVTLANNLVVFIFLLFGKPMRRWFGQTRLAKMHKKSII